MERIVSIREARYAYFRIKSTHNFLPFVHDHAFTSKSKYFIPDSILKFIYAITLCLPITSLVHWISTSQPHFGFLCVLKHAGIGGQYQ